MKAFLAAGDVLINPALLAYAVVQTDTEGPQVRLGFAGPAGDAQGEILLGGLEARSVLRWLRTNAEFLDPGVPAAGRRSASPVRTKVEPVGPSAGNPACGLRLATAEAV